MVLYYSKKTGSQKVQMNLTLLSLSNKVFEFKFQLSVVNVSLQ